MPSSPLGVDTREGQRNRRFPACPLTPSTAQLARPSCETQPVTRPQAPANDATGVFLAYPGHPELTAECMRTASKALKARGIASSVWQDLPIEGHLMIQQILRVIDDSNTVMAEIGSLNCNVLFELGYAIAKDKHAWAVLDETDTSATQNWRDFGLLRGVGRVDYGGSSDLLIHKFSQARPDLSGSDTLWAELYSNIRSPRLPGSLFHYATASKDDAGRAVTSELSQRSGLKVLQVDEDERGAAQLEWFVDKIHSSVSVLVHLMSPKKARANIHNARASFLAGLAHGLERRLLILAPEDLDVPLDYASLLFRYEARKHLIGHLAAWLDEPPATSSPSRPPGKTKIDVEIPLSFGEYVAEDERSALASYFVNTGEYQKVIQSGTAIFVGRKGTGKTATMLRAADELRTDKRNLVVPLKPAGYELESLVEVLGKLPDKATADYFLEGLWKFLLYTEVACAAVAEGEAKPAGIAPGSKLHKLSQLVESHGLAAEEGFAVRLERVVAEVAEGMDDLPDEIRGQRGVLNQRLHAAALHDFRKAIGEALADRERVAILIDNLDKAWEPGADYEKLSRMIFGLLTAVGRVASDFARDDMWKKSVNVTLAVFLRADIFSVVRKYAQEPDKIKTLQVHWGDPALLARVIEDRYIAAKGEEAQPADLWNFFFSPEVHGVPTRDYLLWRCLSRPRDMIFICNSAVLQAVNARRSMIEEPDVIAAEAEYSLFAFEALLVESDPHAGLSELLFEFAGMPATLEESGLRTLLSPHVDDVDETIGVLVRSSFIGIETDAEHFEYPMDETSERKVAVLARNFRERSGTEARYRIHPAYRPYLEVYDDDLPDEL